MEKHGIIPGISKKLADDNKLDDITNDVFKAHDTIQKLPNASSDSIAAVNYIHNKKVDLSSYNDSYINDQNTGAVSKLKFGVSTMDNNGCGVIATYNAMKALGNKKDIRDIAYYYESDGQALGGLFGTNPYAIKRYFENEGYKVKSIEGEKITKEKLPEADAYIVTFWNSDNAMDAMHTVAMRKKNDKYELFNNNPRTERSDVAQTLREALLKDGAVPLSVHCISK